MKNIILLLTFMSALAYGASGTVELGPTIGGGGGGGAVDSVNGQTGVVVLDASDVGAAAQDLSNLTSPTAINQSLLFGTDATYDIGATLASRPKRVYASDFLSVGHYPFGGAAPGAAMINGGSPGFYAYNGGPDAYAFTADSSVGASIQNFGASVSLLNVQNHLFRFMDVSAGAGIYYFQGAPSGIKASTGLEIDTTTGALLLPRMSTADRDALTAVNGMEIYNSDDDKFQSYEDSAWVDAIGGGGGGANTTLSNLTSPTALNQPLGDSGGVKAADISGRKLYDTSGNVVSIDWQQGVLTSPFDGNPAIQWGGGTRSLYDQTGTLSLQFDNRLLRDNSALTVVDWQNTALQDHTQALALDWGTDTAALRVGAGKSLVMKNNQPLSWRKADDSADIPILFLDAFNRTTLGDGLGTNMVFNNSFIPSSALSFDIGTGGDEFRAIYVGSIHVPGTITAGGTTGAQTINKTSGTVNFAALASSLVVTDSFVSATSIVLAVVRTADSTATIKNVVPGSGSFTITLGAAATAETSVGFLVINQ